MNYLIIYLFRLHVVYCNLQCTYLLNFDPLSLQLLQVYFHRYLLWEGVCSVQSSYGQLALEF